MRSIAGKVVESQEELETLGNKNVEHIDLQEFWEEIGRRIKESIRITLEKTISYEFKQFIRALEHERGAQKEKMFAMVLLS